MKKSLFIIPLALAMVLSSCGEPASDDTGSDTSSTTQESSSDSSSSTSTSTTTDTSTSSSSSTTTTPPPGPTPVDPTSEKAAIVVGQTAFKFEAMSREASWPANLVEKYKATVGTVTADQELKLYYDGVQVSEHIGPEPDDLANLRANNVKTSDSKFYVENYAINTDVYFNKYDDGYGFWVTGGTRQVVPVVDESPWYIKGSMNDWEINDDYQLEISESTASNVSEEHKITKSFNAGDQFKFYDNTTDTWIGFDNIENPTEALVRDPSSNNIIVNVLGEYTFYLKKLENPVDGKGYLFYVDYPDTYTFSYINYVRRYSSSGYSFTELYANPENSSEVYTESPIELVSGDIVDIVLGDNEYRYSSVKPESVNYGVDFVASEYGFIEINISGSYNFYTHFNDDESRGSTYIARYMKSLVANYDTSSVYVGDTFDMDKFSAHLLDGSDDTDVKDQVVITDENENIVDNSYVFESAGFYNFTVTYTDESSKVFHAYLEIAPLYFTYSLYFSAEKSVGLRYSGEASEGRVQYEALNVEFKAGDTFDIFDIKAPDESAHFVPGIENKNFSEYVIIDGSTYSVVHDFKADVFVKLKAGDDLIWFNVIQEVTGAKVKLGDNEPVDMEEIDPDPLDTKMIAQFQYVADLSKGEVIEFYVNDEKLSITTSGNAIVKDDVITVRKSGENLTIYLKVYAFSFDSYVTGFEDIDVDSWYLMGTPNSWEFDNDYEFIESDPEQIPAGCYAQLEFTTRLSAGDEFKIHKETDDQWIGWTKDGEAVPPVYYVEEGCRDNFEQSTSDDNIKCKNEGVYTIYLKVLEGYGNGYSLWISKLATNVLNVTYSGGNITKSTPLTFAELSVSYIDEVGQISFVTNVATYEIDDSPVDLTSYSFDTAGDVTVSVKYSPDGITELTATFTVHVIEVGSISVECFVTGNNIANWWNNDDVNTYAYVWNGSGEDDTFYAVDSITAVSDNEIKIVVTLPEEYDHILLVRVIPEYAPTVPTNWDFNKHEGWGSQTTNGDIGVNDGYYYSNLQHN